jgi:hypothetical protein
MNDSTKSKLLGYAWQFLVVLATTLGGYLTAGKEELRLPATLTMTASGAVLGLLGVWAWWSYLKIRETSKEEKVRRARQDGRNICECSETGEIMRVIPGLINNANETRFMKCPRCGEKQIKKYDWYEGRED